MEELLKNKDFKNKMSGLSSGVKQWFINALVDLFEQESEYVIDVLEDCRFELGVTAQSFGREAEQLRAASRMLEERRDENSRSVSRAASRGAPSRLSLVDENTSQIRRRERSRRRMCISDDDSGRSPSSLSVPSYPVAARSPSPGARTTRSLPVTPQPPPNVKNLEEETKAILQSMNDADAHAERERERQQERLERIRKQKRLMAEDRTVQALRLLEKALEMDRVLAKDKERQGKLLQDKLQDMKKRRSDRNTPAPLRESDTIIEDLEKY
ncbi:hypothetical protein BaRGS_00012870 [Batillaria attramentaria]|uniref:Uncharacterized protein n=1 Tax=Batillaria attramentaria TaxID=370345 RepID=A0ABD0L9K9_9CAEN|nr:hypothetical protein BaRGS_030749 [Batillaria attramentaria]